MIKNISVFASQVYCLFKIKNLLDNIKNKEYKEVFANTENMKTLKERFVRFATEEILRRNAN